MSGGLYERVLGGVGRLTPRPPRASAAVIPWRRSARGLEVFWVERAPEVAFMAGWYAFPGGTVAGRDAEIPVRGEPAGADEGPEDGGMPEEFLDAATADPLLSPGVVAAALRELFEETGLLLSERPVAAPQRRRWRDRLLAGDDALADLLTGGGVALVAERLVTAGRWLTPTLGPLRFDSRFFLLHWPVEEESQPEVVPGELSGGEWIEAGAALAACRRGDHLAAPPIVHALRVLEEAGPLEGLGRLRDAREANLGPFRRIEFRPGFQLFPLRTRTLPPAVSTNCYLVGSRDGVLIDPGSDEPGEIDRLLQGLRVCAEQGRRPREIWLTHHHPDHVGGVPAVGEALQLPVAAHAEAARRLRQRGIRVDRELEEGTSRVLDGDPEIRLRVLHTPGHAPGHVCFHDEIGGTLLAGDLVSGVSTIVIDPPEGEMDAYLGSLRRCAALAPRTLLPAHGPALARPVSALEEAVEHRLWREERILAAWRAGFRTPAAMLPSVYDDVPEQAWPLAERQIVAHLERLRAHGRLPGDHPDETEDAR